MAVQVPSILAQTMKTFRSCLFMTVAAVGGPILLVVLLFVGGDFYGRWRTAQVTQGLASLARELGYTADDHLHHEIVMMNLRLRMTRFILV